MSNLLARYNAAFASVSTTLDDSMAELLDEVPPPSILNSSNMVPSAIGATATESYLVDRLRSVSNSGKYVEKLIFSTTSLESLAGSTNNLVSAGLSDPSFVC